jgi:hypothetical protein
MKDETAIGVNVWQRRRVTKLAQKSAGRTKMTRSVSHIVDVGRRNVAPLYRIVAVERTDDARPAATRHVRCHVRRRRDRATSDGTILVGSDSVVRSVPAAVSCEQAFLPFQKRDLTAVAVWWRQSHRLMVASAPRMLRDRNSGRTFG